MAENYKKKTIGDWLNKLGTLIGQDIMQSYKIML